MKKYIFLTISLVSFFCIVICCFCVLKHIKTYKLLEEGVFLKDLSLKDTNLILSDFEISTIEYINTEYLYYYDGWRENYLVLKMILPFEKAALFEEGFSNNWIFSEIDYFVDWWDIPKDETFVATYSNDLISKKSMKFCILTKYRKGEHIIYYFYTDIYNQNALNIAINRISKGMVSLKQDNQV